MLKLLIGIRNGFSSLISKCFKETSWQPDVSNWDMRILRDWVNNHYVWKQDLAYGLLDNIYSIRHMNWQLKKYGHIKGDCDDLATYTIYLALRAFGVRYAYRINIITQRHVIGLIKYQSEWYWASNGQISDKGFSYPSGAVKDYFNINNEVFNVETIYLGDLT